MEQILAISGLIVLIFGFCYSVFKSFRESFAWGVICLFSGTLAYAIHCWWEDKIPMVSVVSGLGLLFLAMYLGG